MEGWKKAQCGEANTFKKLDKPAAAQPALFVN